MGQEGIANGDAAKVEANNFRMVRTKRVDDFEASAAEVDVEAGVGGGGEATGSEGNQAPFLLAGQDGDFLAEDASSRKKEGFGVGGTAQRAGADGHHPIGAKGANLALQGGDLAQSAAAGERVNPPGQGNSLAEADGVSFFVVNSEGRADLLGEQEFEGIGAEVEHGTAKGEIGHR